MPAKKTEEEELKVAPDADSAMEMEATEDEPTGAQKKVNPYESPSEIQEGGKYFVGGKFVDANGNEVK